MNLEKLERDLWEAADNLRANSKLTAAQYAMPVLGLIFLRHAYNRFLAVKAELEPTLPKRAGKPRDLVPGDFIGKAAIYLPPSAYYEHLLAQPEGPELAEAVVTAMEHIEVYNATLAGILPKAYRGFEPRLLMDLLKTFNRDSLKKASGDVFGKIYEYFLNKFAQTGAQEGGEFFTPPSLVRLIVNIIEPERGTVFDPACGSGGMFVQTGHFIELQRHAKPHQRVVFHGQEKAETNAHLARMNLAVHGLEGDLRIANSFYDEQPELINRCDFVMANPPFNVDGVNTDQIKKQVGQWNDEAEAAGTTQMPEAGKRLPFGLPGTNAKTKAISNANSLWVQYFYAYLNATGRAGFVMASSASDAGNKDKDIRRRLVSTGHVDTMVAIGPKFFYTRSLPCTLWFFDKAKPQQAVGNACNSQDRVLMLDARNVYNVESARHHRFTEEQLANLTAIVWLHRGEDDKFRKLVANYQSTARKQLGQLESILAERRSALSRRAGPSRELRQQGNAGRTQPQAQGRRRDQRADHRTGTRRIHQSALVSQHPGRRNRPGNCRPAQSHRCRARHRRPPARRAGPDRTDKGTSPPRSPDRPTACRHQAHRSRPQSLRSTARKCRKSPERQTIRCLGQQTGPRPAPRPCPRRRGLAQGPRRPADTARRRAGHIESRAALHCPGPLDAAPLPGSPLRRCRRAVQIGDAGGD